MKPERTWMFALAGLALVLFCWPATVRAMEVPGPPARCVGLEAGLSFFGRATLTYDYADDDQVSGDFRGQDGLRLRGWVLGRYPKRLAFGVGLRALLGYRTNADEPNEDLFTYRYGNLLEPGFLLRFGLADPGAFRLGLEAQLGPTLLLPGGDLADDMQADHKSGLRFGLHAGAALAADFALLDWLALRAAVGPTLRWLRLGWLGDRYGNPRIESVKGTSLTASAGAQLAW